MSVGALEQQSGGLDIAAFSNTFPQISAPGVNVLSVKAAGGLRNLSGTSMATPHAAGVAALWWEEIMNTALPHTTSVVTARMLAKARIDSLLASVDVADRGVGIATAP